MPAMVGFSQGLVGFLWSSNGYYNIFANDRESIENLAKYVLFLTCFASLENSYLCNMIVYCFTQQNVLGIMLPKNVPVDLIFI